MSLKKRMFRSNMMILLSALVSLMLVVGIVAIVFEDALTKDIESVDNSQLDQDVNRVVEIMRQGEEDQWKQLEQELKAYQYKLLVLKENDIVYGGQEKYQRKILKDFKVKEHVSSEPEVFFYMKMTAVGQYYPESKTYAMAVKTISEKWWISSYKYSFTSFLFALFLTGVAAIAVLLLLSGYFTRRLCFRIMEPLTALSSGAERIQKGNLEEMINYRGDEEFERVCDTFNKMQKTIFLNRQQRLADEKARTDMVTGISHDLRTPLTSIQGYIKGILDGVANTEEKKEIYLKTAYEATEEMNVLLQKLFDFSRMESGQMPLHMVKGDLAEFTAIYVAQREVGLEDRKAVISFSKEAEIIPEIHMDIDQIRRIFDNLLENSIKYAGILPVKINIRIFVRNSEVVLEWGDNGNGVAKEKLGRIFERFYCCDEARTKKGSGVGLYVVKWIVERHGGYVTAENNGGLLISLYFPKGG